MQNKKLDRFQPLRPASAGHLNKAQSQILNVVTGSEGIQVSQVGNRISISQTPKTRISSDMKMKNMEVIEVHSDYIVCRAWSINVDGVETRGETSIYVAKPYYLRRTPFDGVGKEQTYPYYVATPSEGVEYMTIQYTYNNTFPQRRKATILTAPEAGYYEYQHITPPYYTPQTVTIGSEVKETPGEIITALSANTGVYRKDEEGNDINVSWLHINTGKVWGRV